MPGRHPKHYTRAATNLLGRFGLAAVERAFGIEVCLRTAGRKIGQAHSSYTQSRQLCANVGHRLGATDFQKANEAFAARIDRKGCEADSASLQTAQFFGLRRIRAAV